MVSVFVVEKHTDKNLLLYERHSDPITDIPWEENPKNHWMYWIFHVGSTATHSWWLGWDRDPITKDLIMWIECEVRRINNNIRGPFARNRRTSSCLPQSIWKNTRCDFWKSEQGMELWWNARSFGLCPRPQLFERKMSIIVTGRKPNC